MQKCDYCGSTILVGGTQDEGLTFCNAQCASQAPLVIAGRAVSAAHVTDELMRVWHGPCPECQGSGPVDVHTSYRVWSFLIYTSWSSHPRLSCRACGRKAKLGDGLVCLFAGWWGIPWGLVMTPVQLGRNLVGAIFPGVRDDAPSPHLESMVRTQLAIQRLQQSNGAEG